MKTHTRLAAVLALSLLLVAALGCRKNTTASAPVSIEQKILQYNQIVAVTNDGLATTLGSLQTAGIVSSASVAQIATYQLAVTQVTTGIAQVVPRDISWVLKAQQLQNLALAAVPPSGYAKLGISNPTQYQAVVTAIDTIESTLRMVVQIAKQQALSAPAGS